mmetsp:Transcript_23902/g.38973  ORF Transcript_23902/g.38973 Transcript_23902/m.38973 type:complete len:94 (-) Transcript_23902:45-326(-)
MSPTEAPGRRGAFGSDSGVRAVDGLGFEIMVERKDLRVVSVVGTTCNDIDVILSNFYERPLLKNHKVSDEVVLERGVCGSRSSDLSFSIHGAE